MKKRMIVVLAGMMCLTALSSYAQTKETTRDKILRLELENRALKDDVMSLTREVGALKDQLSAARNQRAYPNVQSQTSGVKPYYANAQIQQKCEQYAKCAKWAAKAYQYHLKYNRTFQVTEIKEESYFKESKSLGGRGETIYRLWLYTNLYPKHPCVYLRWGKGLTPVSWKDKMVLSGSYMHL